MNPLLNGQVRQERRARVWARIRRMEARIEEEGGKYPCDIARLDWLSRALCRALGAAGVEAS